MRIRELSENYYDAEYLGSDMVENLGRAFYQGLVAEAEDGIAGAVVWEYLNLEEEWDTESAIRFLRMKNKETAEALLGAYAEIARKRETVWTHLTLPVKEGKEGKAILKELGFQLRLSESDQIVVSQAELMTTSLMKSKTVPDEILPLSEISVRQFRKGIVKCIMNGKKGLCEDLWYLPLSYFERDLSCCFQRDGEINSFFLIHRMPSGLLSVRLMASMDKEYQRILPYMMRHFVLNARDKYGAKAKIHLDRHNEASLKLSEKLLPRHFGTPIYVADRKEKGAVEHDKKPTDMDQYILMF